MTSRIHIREEAARCLFCEDAPCSKVCKNGDPARAIRAIRFGNEPHAGRWLKSCTANELKASEEACTHYDRPIRISDLAHEICNQRSRVSEKITISGYSGRAIKPIALRYILQLASNHVLKNVSLSGIGGNESWRDAMEFILLGCRNVQVCTAVMQYGYRIIDDLKLGVQTYMAQRGIDSLEQLVGLEVKNFVSPHDLDRSTVVYPKFNPELCIGCGRCHISCSDGGHQAISFDKETRRPRLNGKKCVGCLLCTLVCPAKAINHSKRVQKTKD